MKKKVQKNPRFHHHKTDQNPPFLSLRKEKTQEARDSREPLLTCNKGMKNHGLLLHHYSSNAPPCLTSNLLAIHLVFIKKGQRGNCRKVPRVLVILDEERPGLAIKCIMCLVILIYCRKPSLNLVEKSTKLYVVVHVKKVIPRPVETISKLELCDTEKFVMEVSISEICLTIWSS